MNNLYLVSVIERGEDGDDFYTDSRLFSTKESADKFYTINLNTFQEEMKDVCFDDCLMAENRNTFTWNGSGNHWEIHLTELSPE